MNISEKPVGMDVLNHNQLHCRPYSVRHFKLFCWGGNYWRCVNCLVNDATKVPYCACCDQVSLTDAGMSSAVSELFCVLDGRVRENGWLQVAVVKSTLTHVTTHSIYGSLVRYENHLSTLLKQHSPLHLFFRVRLRLFYLPKLVMQFGELSGHETEEPPQSVLHFNPLTWRYLWGEKDITKSS